MSTLAERVVAIERALRDAQVPHAFGGALALAFHIAEPRGTRDIDVNVFVDENCARAILDLLPTGVRWTDADLEVIARDGQVRLFWDDTPVDLFFATHRLHRHASERTEAVPFAGTTIPILSATDLTVFKAFFDRTKDWADIEAMVDAGTVDVHAALGWLVDIVGGDDHRVDRLRRLLDRVTPASEPRFPRDA
jgi:hypothetical protein